MLDVRKAWVDEGPDREAPTLSSQLAGPLLRPSGYLAPPNAQMQRVKDASNTAKNGLKESRTGHSHTVRRVTFTYAPEERRAVLDLLKVRTAHGRSTS